MEGLSLAASPYNPDVFFSGYRSGAIVKWDLSSGQQVVLKGHTGAAVYKLVASPDDQRVFSVGYEDRCVKIWNLSDGALIRTIKCTHYLSCVAFLDGILYVAGYQTETLAFDSETGEMIRKYPKSTDNVYGLVLLPGFRISSHLQILKIFKRSSQRNGSREAARR